MRRRDKAAACTELAEGVGGRLCPCNWCGGGYDGEAQGIIEAAQGPLNSVLVGEDLRYGEGESSAKVK